MRTPFRNAENCGKREVRWSDSQPNWAVKRAVSCGSEESAKGESERRESVRQTVSEPWISMMPREVAKRTALSIEVIESGLVQTSRETG